ncbi:oxidoreductase [Steroidobacter agaridevorans]|uniref:Oxidoreductase n=1 Tax=Steroidobacter agaridevorans TaxID=2695856 RepID=A0A829YGG9_9GAMM|nr:xanthine dehydrogenase family protein molybdopterin-binding subunit [Steroidobacter agaridevorans]GFE81762.1 oxidoreductase [Steroidobacter agaridevorans]
MATRSPLSPAINPIEENRQGIIGKPLDRVDGPLKVTGRAKYSYEYRGVKDTTYGFIVGATIGKGRISAIDTSRAESAPRVLAVVTYQNAPKQAPLHPREPGPSRFDRSEPFLFSPEVRYFGEPVALIVAETFEAARHAAGLVSVRYVKDPQAKFDLMTHQSQAYKPKGVNAGMKADTSEGDFDGAFASAAVKIDVTYHLPHEHNMPMEPHATQAVWEGDHLTLYSGQQVAAWAQSSVAKTLQLPLENVRILTPYVGGGFGSKVPIHAQAVLAALGAKVVRRPVKIAQTRPQMFANTNHRPECLQRMRLGATKDGTLTAIAHDVWSQTTPFDEFIEQTAAFSRVMYAAPNRFHRHWGVMLDLPTSDIMRAPGEEPGSVAQECGMDELAVALDMDPIELRIKNEPTDDPETHLPFSSRSLVECYREGAQRFGWSKRPKRPGTLRDGRWLVGYGVASAMFPTYLRPSAAAVRLNADGAAIVKTDMTDIGTGSYTVLTQVAAESLGLPTDKVTVELGDTRLPKSAGSGGSFGAASAGSAILLACEQLRSQIAQLVSKDRRSPLAGANVGEVALRGGNVVAGEKSESLQAVLSRLAPSGIEGKGEHQGAEKQPKYSSHVFGAQFAEVGVDIDTGEIRVRRMLGVFGSGRILNPKTARSQLIGGMIMGIGAGLTEESVVDPRDGSFVNRDLAEYHVPVHADVTQIEAICLEEKEPYANPLGIKGLGEVGIVGVAAALANAVYNATGVRVREFPITLDKVLGGLPDTIAT